MLIWLDSGEQVTEIGKRHKSFFSAGEKRLSSDEIERIKQFINSEIDTVPSADEKSGDRAYVPGWHSPADWEGTPLEPIYKKACPGDSTLSAYWYGLVTMQIIIDRPETWYAAKTQFKGRTIDQTVYWLRE